MTASMIHWDGISLLFMAMAVLALGHTFRRWSWRLPLLTVGLCDLILALETLGSRSFADPLPWASLRLVSDTTGFVLVTVWLCRRYGLAQKAMGRPAVLPPVVTKMTDRKRAA